MPCKGRSSSSSSKECCKISCEPAGRLLQYWKRWLEQVIHECCKTSIDLQAYVLGPYAIVLDKSVCGFASLVKQKNYTWVAFLCRRGASKGSPHVQDLRPYGSVAGVGRGVARAFLVQVLRFATPLSPHIPPSACGEEPSWEMRCRGCAAA